MPKGVYDRSGSYYRACALERNNGTPIICCRHRHQRRSTAVLCAIDLAKAETRKRPIGACVWQIHNSNCPFVQKPEHFGKCTCKYTLKSSSAESPR